MLRRLLAPLEARKWRSFRLTALILIAGPLSNFHPLVWRYMVDGVLLGGRPDHLLPAVLVMLGVHLGGSAVGHWTAILGRDLVEELGAELRGQLHRRLLSQGAAFHQQRPTGEVLARVMGDVDAVAATWGAMIGGLANALVNLVWVVSVLVFMEPKLAAVSFLPVLLVVPLGRAFNRRAEPRYRRWRERLGNVSQGVQEDLQGLDVTRAFGREEQRGAAMQGVLDAGVRAASSANRASVLFTYLLSSLGFVTNALIAGVGVYWILHGSMTLGTLVAFRGYWGTLYGLVQGLGALNDQVQRGLAAAGRCFEVLDAPLVVPPPAAPVRPERIEGRLVLEAVELAYVPGVPVLRGVSFEVEPGAQLGLVGPSGGGKSSLLGLMLRFRDPDAGRVLLDGVDLRQLDPAVLRRQVAFVPQEAFLFAGTVADNLRMGRPEARDEELWTALEQARARDFVEALEGGLQARVGERGGTLSGGQRQRLCIARAFLADPAVLLLDEATSAVEPEAEASICEALASLMKGRTTVIVSHRPAMLRQAARVLQIEGGRVVAAPDCATAK